MRYRITTRGKIVLVVFIILVLASAISLLSPSKPTEMVAEIETDQDQSTDTLETDVAEEPENAEEQPLEENETDDLTEENNTTDEVIEAVLKDAGARIHFKPDKYELIDTEIKKLDVVIETHALYMDQMIIIEGNINGYPQYDDTEFGMTLSDKRAEVVKAYLIEQGIAKEKIYIFSLGSQKPIQNTSNPTESWKNRRTDVYFKDYNDLEY